MNDYYNKYLKYKNKYLKLKYGGEPKYIYIPPSLRDFERNYYIYIKKDLFLDLSFKDKLVSNLESNGYKSSSKENASVVYIYGQEKYPTQKTNESSKEYLKRKHAYETQFKHVHMINMLYGEFKEIITFKARFHEYFKDNQIIKKYLTPWSIIKKETRYEDISKIKFLKGEQKVLKANNGYKSMGTILVETKEEICKHIEFYDVNPLYSNEEQTQVLKANDWILENLINQDKIEGRKFYMRVDILVICRSGHTSVYISKVHPYAIMKIGLTDKFLSIQNVDDVVGSHLSKYSKKGGGWGNRMEDGKRVIYDLEKNAHWPTDLPDNYNTDDVLKIDNDLKELFINIFNDPKVSKLRPDYNSPNGFENFGCDVSLENKQVRLHEINRRTGLELQAPFIPDIIKIYNHDEDFNYFTKII